MPDKFHWTDVEDLGELLAERHADRDAMAIRFTELKQLVKALPEFEEKPGLEVNEKILEHIQAAWIEAKQDLADNDDDND